MDIRMLRYFLAVAEEENITRAAANLHIAQPSLSKQIMELEAELGKPLFVRGRRRTTLTEDGLFLRRRAGEIVALLDKTEREIGAGSPLVHGTVDLGGTPTKTILRAAAATRTAHPGIRFDFHCGDATEVMERLDHGRLDFAVLLEPVDPVKCEYLSLPDAARWGLLLPRRSALSRKAAIDREDIRHVPLIVHHRIGLQRELAHWAQTHADRLDIAATYNVVNGDPSVFVRSGLGCLLTSEAHLPERLDADLRFRPLDPPLEARPALVWKRDAPLPGAARAFLEICRQETERPGHQAFFAGAAGAAGAAGRGGTLKSSGLK